MKDFTTPMMKQYMRIKKKYNDCLLFFRLGDFYELFMEDAHIGSSVLGITLTGRPRGKDGKIPMAGVPYHAIDAYLSKLVKAGYKVAICEQITEPNSKGIVEREVVRVVTPGTLLDERALEQKEHNYICAILTDGNFLGMSFCDITTGVFFAKQLEIENLPQQIGDELARTRPAECILPPHLYNDPDFLGLVRQQKATAVFQYTKWRDAEKRSVEILETHFRVSTLASFNIADKPLIVKTSAVLLHYLKETQKSGLPHIQKITLKLPDTSVHLDRATIINLELFSTIRDRDVKGSLLSTIDNTQTPMGGRMLKNWILQPLTNKKNIEKRLDATAEILENTKLHMNLKKSLSEMNDVERIFSRVTIGIGNARDLVNLSQNAKRVLDAKHLIVDSKSELLQKIQKQIKPKLWDLVKLIENSIVDEPPILLKEGGLIKYGVHKRLDELRDIVSGGKTWIAHMEQEERKRTGISSLKLRYNKVFGYFIEISKSNLHLAPENYIRKQTLVNGERFITEALKEKEELILRSEDELKLLEYELYKEILEKVLVFSIAIQEACNSIATLDCLVSNATLAKDWRYTRPTIVYSQELKIKGGRHPVVEQTIGRNNFIPNDISFAPTHTSLFLVTGPNMAGKSVYLRQTALITLLALTGSFVPAKSAHISLVDAIFVRSGASDVITSGLSTFMVEMVETAYILNHATEKSLIIMDEIGRGTSTYDGVSIAWATAEYIVKAYHGIPKTLFATHYFELTKLENMFPKKIANIHMAVHEEHGTLTFLHRIKEGKAERSFGVAVASLAGIPKEVISNASKMLESIENPTDLKKTYSEGNVSNQFKEFLHSINVDELTPLQALNLISKLKEDYS